MKKKNKIGGSSVFSFFTQQLKNWCSMIELLKAWSASGLLLWSAPILIEKKGTDDKKNDVKGESDQEKEKQIMVKKKKLNDQRKEKEVEKEKENEKKKQNRRKQCLFLLHPTA